MAAVAAPPHTHAPLEVREGLLIIRRIVIIIITLILILRAFLERVPQGCFGLCHRRDPRRVIEIKEVSGS